MFEGGVARGRLKTRRVRELRQGAKLNIRGYELKGVEADADQLLRYVC